jgi:ADP-heptose:LPS heptosyltransferase
MTSSSPAEGDATMIPVGHRDTAGLPRVVVLRALGLGDLLTGVPALRAVRAAFPRHELVLAVPAFLTPLVRLLDGTVDTVVDVDFRDRVGPLPQALHAPDVAVNLHGRGPESHAALLALDPGRLIAWHLHGVHAGPRWRDDEHERARWCRLLRGSDIPADPADHLLRPPSDCVPAEFAGATIVHPGASAPARRWPVERWAAVARHELDRGNDVIITGDANEAELAKAVASHAGVSGQWVVAGHTDVEELTALVCAAARVACGDTGVAHMAAALATPSVVVFGPTSPARWGPPQNGRHTVLWAGQTADPHADKPDDGLLAITVADVTHALDALPVPSVSAGRMDPPFRPFAQTLHL